MYMLHAGGAPPLAPAESALAISVPRPNDPPRPSNRRASQNLQRPKSNHCRPTGLVTQPARLGACWVRWVRRNGPRRATLTTLTTLPTLTTLTTLTLTTPTILTTHTILTVTR